MPLTIDIREALEEYVLEHGVATTAAELGMHRVTLYRILEGKRFVEAVNLDRIGELLGLELRPRPEDRGHAARA